jgi:hypothetical protein
MRLIKILIVIFVCAKNLTHALPVQSKALENVDDQLFWQAAWFSEDANNERPASPFTSDSKRISAKSIFIFPPKAKSYCAEGFRIDDTSGKCIKIVSVHQTSEESKLAALITTDDTENFDYDYWNGEDEYTQTTDNESLKLPLVPILNESGEGNGNESHEDGDDENAKKVVIVKEHVETHSTSSVTEASNAITTSRVPPTSAAQTFQGTHHESKTDSVQVIIATLSSDDDDYGWEGNNEKTESGSMMMTYEHDTATTSVNEFKGNEREKQQQQNENEEEENEKFERATFSSSTTTTTTTTIAPFENENITEMNSNENEATSVMQDRGSEDNQNVEPATTTDENGSNSSSSSSSTQSAADEDEVAAEYGENSALLNETTTEGAIIEQINFDDVSLLQNESLLISYESVNGTGIDYEDVTTLEPPLSVDTVSSSTDSSFAYEGSTDDDSSSSSISSLTTEEKEEEDEGEGEEFKYESIDKEQDSANRFVYQHLTSVTERPTSTETIGRFKFPSDIGQRTRIKFPDDEIAIQSTSAPRFSWPRENPHRLTTNIFQFWNEQPLIADSLQRIRDNSKSFRENFFPYTTTTTTENQKVQIVTPQRRFSHK